MVEKIQTHKFRVAFGYPDGGYDLICQCGVRQYDPVHNTSQESGKSKKVKGIARPTKLG